MTGRSKPILGLALLIVGLALCGFGLSLLLKPAQYAATARINLEMQSRVGTNDADYGYGSYFPQVTFHIMQSQLVLGSVITNLNLNEVWGRKYFGGKPLKTSKTLTIIQSRLTVASMPNTRLVDITFYSDDPNEAAQVANAIAKAYGDYRMNKDKEMTKEGLAILQQQYQEEEKQISILQTDVEQLRQKFDIQGAVITPKLPEQQPYWDEMGKLKQRIEWHKLLYAKIESVKVDLQIPKTTPVQIVNPAEPPKSPVGPNRFLGAVLLALGLFTTVAGLFLFKPSVQD